MERPPSPNGDDTITLRCDACELPVARIVGDCLVIEAKHHGRRHKTVIEIAHILRLIAERDARRAVV